MKGNVFESVMIRCGDSSTDKKTVVLCCFVTEKDARDRVGWIHCGEP